MQAPVLQLFSPIEAHVPHSMWVRMVLSKCLVLVPSRKMDGCMDADPAVGGQLVKFHELPATSYI
jgi:hypothetical protein